MDTCTGNNLSEFKFYVNEASTVDCFLTYLTCMQNLLKYFFFSRILLSDTFFGVVKHNVLTVKVGNV